MTTYRHARYDIVSWYDLTDEQKETFDYEYAEEGSFARNKLDDNDIHDLDTFMRISDSRYHGIASCTNTSAYGIILSNCGEEAVIALIG